MAETYLTIIGNLTSDAELRFTGSGAAVASFTVASTPRTFNRQTNEFEDGETLFQRCSVWREQAENVAESLTKGTEVIVHGRLKSRTYETKEGQKRTTTEVDVEHVGPSLRKATAKVTRAGKGPQRPQDGFSAPNTAQQPQQSQWPQNGAQTGFSGFEPAPF